jgi:hypothetical protein
MPQIENAQIESTMLGNEDHGIFTCYVTVSGDCWGCGFGGYALDKYDSDKKRRVGTAYGLEFIKRILETLEIEEWEKLPGTPVRVETNGVGGGILRIGHFRKNRWFDPKQLLQEMP